MRDGIIASQGLFSLLISSGIKIEVDRQELYNDRFTRSLKHVQDKSGANQGEQRKCRKSQLIG